MQKNCIFSFFLLPLQSIINIYPLSRHRGMLETRLPNTMAKYICDVCGYEYDPEVGDPDNGIAAGTAFEDLPADWACPLCGVGKDQFTQA